MKIYTYGGRLVEEIGYATSKVIFLRVIRDEDKDKCPHCGKPIQTDLAEVEDSPNYQNNAKPVKTLGSKENEERFLKI